MTKLILEIGLLTAMLIFPATTWSQPGPPPMLPGGGPGFMQGHGGGPGHHGPGMAIGRWWEHPEVQKKLELTPEQVEKIGSQRLETETKMIEVSSKKRIAQLRLRDLVSKKNASEEEINKWIDEIGNLQKEQMKAVIAQTRGIRSILTEEQQTKVDKFLKTRRERFQRGPRFLGGPGAREDQPGDRGPGKGDMDGRGGKHGKGLGEGKGRGEGKGPGPFGGGFGMAPDGPMDQPGLAGPGGPGLPPQGCPAIDGPAGPGLGGPAVPPDMPEAPDSPREANGEGPLFPPQPESELGMGEGDLDAGFLMDDFASFDEPIEDILADFE